MAVFSKNSLAIYKGQKQNENKYNFSRSVLTTNKIHRLMAENLTHTLAFKSRFKITQHNQLNEQKDIAGYSGCNSGLRGLLYEVTP